MALLDIQGLVDDIGYDLGLLETETWLYYADDMATPVEFEAHQIESKEASTDRHSMPGESITLSASASSFAAKPVLGFVRPGDVTGARYDIEEVEDQGHVNYFIKINGG